MLIQGLLPPFIAVAEGIIDENQGQLLPPEEAHIVSVIAKRRSEFTAGRILARQALSRIGAATVALLPDKDRVPVWPAGFTGSITHTDDYAAAVAVKLSDAAAIGIDIENVTRFHAKLEPYFLTPSETGTLGKFSPDVRQVMAALTFSAKEAFIKCQFSLTGKKPGLQEMEVTLYPDSHRFQIQLKADMLPLEKGAHYEGRYAENGGQVGATLVFPAEFPSV